MSWSERHEFFERLLEMRDAYARRDDDRVGVLSIADAVTYVDAVMCAVDIDIGPWLAELDRVLNDEPDPAVDGERDAPAAPGTHPGPQRPDRPDRPARRRLLGDVDLD